MLFSSAIAFASSSANPTFWYYSHTPSLRFRTGLTDNGMLQFKSIQDFVAGGKNVIDWFDKDTRAKFEALFGDMAKYVLYEYAQLDMTSSISGARRARLEFQATFKVGDPVAIAIGLLKDGVTTWYPVEAVVFQVKPFSTLEFDLSVDLLKLMYNADEITIIAMST